MVLVLVTTVTVPAPDTYISHCLLCGCYKTFPSKTFIKLYQTTHHTIGEKIFKSILLKNRDKTLTCC